MCQCVYGVAVSFSDTHIQRYIVAQVCRWWSLVASMEILGCLEPWCYGGTLVLRFSGIGSSDSWVLGTLVTLDLRNFGVPLSYEEEDTCVNPGVTLPLDPRTRGCSEPLFYCTLETWEPCFYVTLASWDSLHLWTPCLAVYWHPCFFGTKGIQ